MWGELERATQPVEYPVWCPDELPFMIARPYLHNAAYVIAAYRRAVSDARTRAVGRGQVDLSDVARLVYHARRLERAGDAIAGFSLWDIAVRTIRRLDTDWRMARGGQGVAAYD